MSHRPVLTVLLALLASPATAAEPVTFGTDWRAQAEHGGFYQALATGLYARHGLEVTIRQGGPQVNHAQLLAAGRLDFNMAPNSFVPLNFVRENIPVLGGKCRWSCGPWASSRDRAGWFPAAVRPELL